MPTCMPGTAKYMHVLHMGIGAPYKTRTPSSWCQSAPVYMYIRSVYTCVYGDGQYSDDNRMIKDEFLPCVHLVTAFIFAQYTPFSTISE